MNKEEYKKEIVRMWDTIRTEHKTEYKGSNKCLGVNCDDCPFGCLNCESPINTFEMIEILEKWSKEHPIHYYVSQMEYDILCTALDYEFVTFDYWLGDLVEKGYFKGADVGMELEYYFNHCEVLDK